MTKKKSPSHHLYYGIIKSTTEHWYSRDEYFEHIESDPGALSPDVTIIRRYARDGRMTKMENFGGGKLEYITEYEFNANGQIISSVDIDPDGKPTRKSVDICNQDSLIEEWRVYSDMENLDFKMRYSYDSRGKRLSESTIHENHNDNSTTFFEYSDDNTITSIFKDDKGRILGKTIDKYDSTGNLISFREYDEFGSLEREVFYTYDIHNNLLTVKMKHYSEEGIEYTGREYEYLLDHRDNWIRLICNPDDVLYANVCIREIEYY